MRPTIKLGLIILVASACILGALREADAEAANFALQPKFKAETNAVRVPVVVIDKKGQLLTTLSRDNFRVLEDGVEKEITAFDGGRAAPLTVVVLLEYSEIVRYLRAQVVRPAGILASQILGPDDYAALIAFDSQPRVLADFTRNRQLLLDAVNQLVLGPSMSRESNLYDAVYFALRGGVLEGVEYKGLAEVAGRTGLLVVATGINTFSRTSYQEVRRAAANSGVPIYSIAIGELAYIQAEPYLTGLQRLDYLQARNFLDQLSKVSGGRSYSVRFEASLDEVLESIVAMLRFQYTLTYNSSPQEGKKRKRNIEVLVDVDGDGKADNDRLELQYRREYRTDE